MWNEKLKSMQNPRIEFGTIDASVSFEPFDVPDDCFDSLSVCVAEFLFSESEETFERLLNDLGQCPATMIMDMVLDPLGIYVPSEKMIKIDENKIHLRVCEMQKRGASLSFSDLSEIVRIHEDKHALHHLAGDSRSNGEIWIQFGNHPSFILEMLAQLFTFHEVSGDKTKENAFFELERYQSIVYHLWRLFRKCDKERLYWGIRDSYSYVDRIIRILQKLGLYQVSYYQVAAGSFGRDYSDLFLKFGMAFVGWGKGKDKVTKVRSFDRIILKQGRKQIKAVGEVVSRKGKCCGKNTEDREKGDNTKDWLDDFDGWDLPYYCFVTWHEPAGDDRNAAASLTRSTFDGVNQQALKDQAEKILTTYPARDHSPEPPPTPKLNDDEILDFLISEGLRASSAEDFMKNLRRIRLLASYYAINCNWSQISEEETKTFLVIPLLQALGWSEQQMKLEYKCKAGKIDLAMFGLPFKKIDINSPCSPSTSDDECILIIEVKKFDQGLNYASDAGKAYADTFKNCNVVIATNGWCYKLYSRKGSGFSKDPSAYLNLLNPTAKYPLDHTVAGAKEVLAHLLRREHVICQNTSLLSQKGGN